MRAGIASLAAASLGLAVAFTWTLEPRIPVRPAAPLPTVDVRIPPGASSAEIAERLAQAGVIRSPLAFRLYVRWKGLDGRLQAGYYRLSPAWSVPQLVDQLAAGRVFAIRVTIPEGHTVDQIVTLLTQRGLASPAALRRAMVERARSWPYLPEGVPLRRPLEGYLFPDTYAFAPDTPAGEIVDTMLRRFEQVFRPEWRERAARMGLTVHQVVTLASIVEREARVPAERPLIAAVYLNRLRRQMKLDADPTVLYALGRSGGRLTRADLAVASPYNTYRHPGLPPGPIANPGEGSLRAVLFPADVDYLYFVLRPDGSGRHAFARTWEEHVRNVARYRRAVQGGSP